MDSLDSANAPTVTEAPLDPLTLCSKVWIEGDDGFEAAVSHAGAIEDGSGLLAHGSHTWVRHDFGIHLVAVVAEIEGDVGEDDDLIGGQQFFHWMNFLIGLRWWRAICNGFMQDRRARSSGLGKRRRGFPEMRGAAGWHGSRMTPDPVWCRKHPILTHHGHPKHQSCHQRETAQF